MTRRIVEITELRVWPEDDDGDLDWYILYGAGSEVTRLLSTYFMAHAVDDSITLVESVLGCIAGDVHGEWDEDYLPTAKKLLADFIRANEDQLWCKAGPETHARIFSHPISDDDVVVAAPEASAPTESIAATMQSRIAQARARGHDGTTLKEQAEFHRRALPLLYQPKERCEVCGLMTGCMHPRVEVVQ